MNELKEIILLREATQIALKNAQSLVKHYEWINGYLEKRYQEELIHK